MQLNGWCKRITIAPSLTHFGYGCRSSHTVVRVPEWELRGEIGRKWWWQWRRTKKVKIITAISRVYPNNNRTTTRRPSGNQPCRSGTDERKQPCPRPDGGCLAWLLWEASSFPALCTRVHRVAPSCHSNVLSHCAAGPPPARPSARHLLRLRCCRQSRQVRVHFLTRPRLAASAAITHSPTESSGNRVPPLPF